MKRDEMESWCGVHVGRQKAGVRRLGLVAREAPLSLSLSLSLPPPFFHRPTNLNAECAASMRSCVKGVATAFVAKGKNALSLR